jgi:hypothetical protein
MKYNRIIISLVMIAAMLGFVGVAYADETATTPVEAAPEATSSSVISLVQLEPYADFVFDRDLSDGSTLKDFNWYGAKANINVNSDVTISPFIAYVDGGSVDTSVGNFDNDSVVGYGVEGSIGVATTLPVDVKLKGGWRQAKPSLDLSSLGAGDVQYQYDEWFVEPQISKTFEANGAKITPSIGVRYSDVSLGNETNGFSTSVGSKDNVGVTAGVKYEVNDNVAVAVNGRFIDETAVNASVLVKY